MFFDKCYHLRVYFAIKLYKAAQLGANPEKYPPGEVTPYKQQFTSRPKCMSGSRDPGVTIVNPTVISVMYGSEGVKGTTQQTFVYHLYNFGPMSKTLGRRCINVIQMFCV